MENREKQLEDCIFILDEVNDSIITSCLECYDNEKNNGMFWNGSVRGYGPWEIKCNFCNKIIQEGQNADQ